MKPRTALVIATLSLMVLTLLGVRAWHVFSPRTNEWVINELSHTPGNSWPRPNTRSAGEPGHFGDRFYALWPRLTAAREDWLSIPPEERVWCRPQATRGEPLNPACSAWLCQMQPVSPLIRHALAADHAGAASAQAPLRCSEPESVVPLAVASLVLAFNAEQPRDDPAATADACLRALSFSRDELWWSDEAADDSRHTVGMVAHACLEAAVKTQGDERERFIAALGRIREGLPPMTLNLERKKLRLLVESWGEHLWAHERARLPDDINHCIDVMEKRHITPLGKLLFNDDDWKDLAEFWATMDDAARAPRSAQRERFTHAPISPELESMRPIIVTLWQQTNALDTLLDALDETARATDTYRATGRWPPLDGGVDWDLSGQTGGALRVRVDSHEEAFTLRDGGLVSAATEWVFSVPDAGAR